MRFVVVGYSKDGAAGYVWTDPTVVDSVAAALEIVKQKKSSSAVHYIKDRDKSDFYIIDETHKLFTRMLIGGVVTSISRTRLLNTWWDICRSTTKQFIKQTNESN